MTQIKLGVSGATGVIVESQESVKCKWKGCRKTHSKEPDYPDDGDLERAGTETLNKAWQDIEPWRLWGDGNDTKVTRAEYKDETKNANYVDNAASMIHPKYHTQKHHLLSVKRFDNFPDLKLNAKLVSYDLNHKNNGACLPTYTLDIARHDLQRHRGSHSTKEYYSIVDELLRGVEKRCTRRCVTDINGESELQKELVSDLDRKSKRMYALIKTWKVLLNKKGLEYRKKSFHRLKNLT